MKNILKIKLARLLRAWADKLSPYPFLLPTEDTVLVHEKELKRTELRVSVPLFDPNNDLEVRAAGVKAANKIREGITIHTRVNEKSHCTTVEAQLVYYV